MSGNNHYKNIILGCGEAGKYISWTLARSGQKTAVIERRYIGGSCPNIACLPSKNVIYSAKVAELCKRAGEFGIIIDNARIDMTSVFRRKHSMVEDLIKVHLEKFRESGAELIMGEGSFVAPKRIEINLKNGEKRELTADRIFLDLGTSATVNPIPGLWETGAYTHIEALNLNRLPDHLIVLGGGYVGLEMAHTFRRFGSKVTIIEYGPQIAQREDPDVSQAIMQFFKEDGIEIILSGEVIRVEGRNGEKVQLLVRIQEDEKVIEGTDILIATGRTPNTKNIGLERAGVEVGSKGYIKVNERLETTAPEVWAMGECAGSPQFTHVAFDDYRIVRDNLAGGNKTTTDRLIPFCMFTDPELARVGMNEVEAKQEGVSYRLFRIPITAVLRTRTLSETRGFMKALIRNENDQLLGFTMLGSSAGEVIAVAQTAMLTGMPYTGLRDAIFTHPTMTEGLNVLFASRPTNPH
ncbi:MAG: dihydrolipoyl dehydrogenase family protein [Smithellaceae bacterium]